MGTASNAPTAAAAEAAGEAAAATVIFGVGGTSAQAVSAATAAATAGGGVVMLGSLSTTSNSVPRQENDDPKGGPISSPAAFAVVAANSRPPNAQTRLDAATVAYDVAISAGRTAVQAAIAAFFATRAIDYIVYAAACTAGEVAQLKGASNVLAVGATCSAYYMTTVPGIAGVSTGHLSTCLSYCGFSDPATDILRMVEGVSAGMTAIGGFGDASGIAQVAAGLDCHWQTGGMGGTCPPPVTAPP